MPIDSLIDLLRVCKMMSTINQVEKSDSLFEIANSWLSTNDVAKILSISPNAVRILT